MIRLKLLSAGKLAALAVFVSVAVILAVYLAKRKERVGEEPSRPKLQGRVVAVFNNTRYTHEVGGRVRFVLTAGVDKTYEDGTHELEQVKLESYGTAEAERLDVITSDQARVSDPANLTRLDAEFISNVVVKIADDLTVKTAYLHYDQMKNTVDTKELVEFEGSALSGRSTGVLIEANEERAHLFKDVDVTIKPASNRPGPGAGGKEAGRRKGETPEERAARKARKRARKQAKQVAKRARGESATNGKPSNKKGSGKEGGVSFVAAGVKVGENASKVPTRIRSASALLEKREGRVTFNGGAHVTQGSDEMRADRMVGLLDDADRIERIEARGDSQLKQGDKVEIKSANMDFFFDNQNLVRAVANGSAYTRTLGPGPAREARAEVIEALFASTPAGNVVETINAQGGAEVKVRAPAPSDGKENPAAREIYANAITLRFQPDGQNIQYAEAKDNAVMKVIPVRAERGSEKKTISAPRMTADFHETGNLVKTFNASDGVKVEIEPTVAGAYPARTTTSNTLAAEFASSSQDVRSIAQEGDFKYNEGDRNAVAERAVYDGGKEVLSLRGKRPMAWDARARTQADEIDYHRQTEQTFARGDVRTTYYSRESTNGSTPFKNAKSPIFMTAERAEARPRDGVAIYTGGARGWQDDNFVKGDRIELYDRDKKMIATGNVESTLYSVRQEAEKGTKETVPGFASADRMTYSDTERLVHYDGSVKARQGADRIEASEVDVYLKKESNEVDRMRAEGGVVLTQPGRRGTGDIFTYTADDGRAVLGGKTAKIEDSEKGSTMGSQLTFYSRDDKIHVDNQQGTGRVRSTHRLTKSNEK